MFRNGVLALLVTCAVGASTHVAGGQSERAAGQRELEGTLSLMTERLASEGRSPQDTIDWARQLAAGYRGLQPAARGFGAADQALNRRLAQQSFAWLSRARVLYGRHPAVNAQLLHAYGAIGGFYRDYGTFYPAAAVTAFGGASRIARGLVLTGGGSQYERDLEQYALAYATAAYAFGPSFAWWRQPTDLQEPPSRGRGQLLPAPPPVELPTVDVTQLTTEQRRQWTDVQDRFGTTSTRVHDARLRMNELAARLERQQLTVNLLDAATAAKMQGFLEDAADLVKTREFALAIEALQRADYERAKLRNVIGH